MPSLIGPLLSSPPLMRLPPPLNDGTSVSLVKNLLICVRRREEGEIHQACQRGRGVRGLGCWESPSGEGAHPGPDEADSSSTCCQTTIHSRLRKGRDD